MKTTTFTSVIMNTAGGSELSEHPDSGETYYEHWLVALERIASDKGS
jgi:hypothetical protein